MNRSETLTIRGTPSPSAAAQESSNQSAPEITSGSLTYRAKQEPVPMTLEIRNFTAISLQTEQMEEPGATVRLPQRALEALSTAVAGENDLPEEL
jgi:hypothetical protein